MRTTLTLDDDVAAVLTRLHEKQGGPLKSLVNEALRRGLHELARPQPSAAPFHTQPLSLGRCLIGSLDNVAEVLAIAEGEDFR